MIKYVSAPRGLAFSSQPVLVFRMRENMLRLVTRQFKEGIEKYQAVQDSYKDEMKKKVTRQVRIVKPNVTDEEIDTTMRTRGARKVV
jgi:t-SNARE complex subunit (syntaxin)